MLGTEILFFLRGLAAKVLKSVRTSCLDFIRQPNDVNEMHSEITLHCVYKLELALQHFYS